MRARTQRAHDDNGGDAAEPSAAESSRQQRLGRRRRPDDEFREAVATGWQSGEQPTNDGPATDPDDNERGSGEVVPLGRLLVERDDLTAAQLDEALQVQTANGERLGEVLVQLGLLSPNAIAAALAAQLGLETVDVARVPLDTELVNSFSAESARELCAIPLRKGAKRIDVAVGDPARPGLREGLIELLRSPVRLFVAPRRDVEEAIDRAYFNQEEITGALREFEHQFGGRSFGAASSLVVDENAPIVKVVNVIFEQAVRDRASDIHLEPQEQRLRVRIRTDGTLHEVLSLPVSMTTPLVSRIKVMANMNIVERRRPQDGQLEISVDGRDLDVRVATASTVFGESCVMRLLDRRRALLDLSELGMTAETYATYEQLIRSPYGMVICAGPTGAGKTTTLYATLAAIDNSEIKVMSIEDPVEYVFQSVNQMQINEQAGVTFAGGLRSILRQDPDAILVGEIRDVETARIAVQAALTGHFVMSSIHATESTSALHRFMDMGIEPFMVASSLVGIVGQRLVRKLCRECIEPYEPSPEQRAFFHHAGGDPEKTAFVHGAGCKVCGHTGYYERLGVYEVLRIDDELKDRIVGNAPLAELRSIAVARGMSTLTDHAVRMVNEDVTTISEILRTVYML